MKPENVMLSGSGVVQIGDFGQSQFFDRRDTFNRTLGTPAYLGAHAPAWACCRAAGELQHLDFHASPVSPGRPAVI